MQGFESGLHEKLRGIHSHITLESQHGQELDVQALNAVIATEFPEVASTALSITQHALLYAAHTDAVPLVAVIKGIDPLQNQSTFSLWGKIITQKSSLEQMIQHTTVLIGKEMANHLDITVGDVLTLAYSDDLSNKKRSITFDTHDLVVGGIFQTGIEEIDTNYLFCDYRLVQKLFHNGEISTLHVTLHKGFDEDIIAKKMEQRFNISAYSWKSLYPAIISALKLEKYAMFWILTLITIVASANIIALLFMLITQKRTDITLLRTLGASHFTIRSIFIIIGSLIAQSACIIGIILAWIVSFFINHYQLISLPDSYYVSYLRADMSISISLVVFIIVSIITFCATLVATRRINKGNIAEIMRYH